MMNIPIMLIAAAFPVLLMSGCAAAPEIAPEVGFPEAEAPRITAPEPAPEPEGPARDYEEITVYVVEPESRVEEPFGYIEVEYIEEGREGTQPRLAVSLGRAEIDHADTKWYFFEIRIDGKHYTWEGRESIPFVRGKDGLWWNEASVKLPESFEEDLIVTIHDRYARQEYRFTITRAVRRIEHGL